MMNMNYLSEIAKVSTVDSPGPGQGSVETAGGTIAMVPEELAKHPSFTGNTETAGGMGAIPFTAQKASNVLEAKYQEVMRRTVSVAPESDVSSEPVRSPMAQAIIDKELARRAEVVQQQAAQSDAVDPAAENAVQKTQDQQFITSDAQHQDISFGGGLGISNIKYLNGAQMVSDGEYKLRKASALRSEAETAMRQGKNGRAGDLRRQASNLESEGRRQISKGKAMMEEAKRERRK